ncbi:MAG: hypothetical protein NVSMB48_04600 [Marmoricola sp.]
MPSVRAHFEDRAASLSDQASLESFEKDGAVTLRLRPHAPKAAGVVLYLNAFGTGSVALDDSACAPAELGDNPVADAKAVDHFIAVAVDGRATAFRLGRGGCVEVRDGDRTSRIWHNAIAWPGWRRWAERVEYEPYS